MSGQAPADGNVLRLFVAGTSPSSLRAAANVRRFLDEHPEQRLALQVVDVLEDPGASLAAGVLATPCLVRGDDARQFALAGRADDAGALAALLD